MLDKIYLEITNVCNLDCSFCHKTSREKKLMTGEEFERLTDRLRGKTKYLYFHLMGEPTLHPSLPEFIDRAQEKGFFPMLTTNGSTLGEKGALLLEHLPYKISISLHAPEANPRFADPSYLDNCLTFAKNASQRGCIVALRLWNLDGRSREEAHHAHNEDILRALREAFPEKWVAHHNGYKLRDRLYLEWGERFDWPSLSAPDEGERGTCYGLKDQIGVLCDGTVVPCCLDHEGDLALGNLFEQDMSEILASPRAQAIYSGFQHRTAAEELCRKCGYARRFL